MFYNLIIAPIETIVSWVFNFMINKFSGFGVIGAICGVSLVINFLALPLYNIADKLQEKERKVSKALEPRVKRIKKAFKGNEQFMMLSTYYLENDYNPLYVLRSSISILIEIPFFIAAYHFLSNCEALKGVSFWIFKDLGAPDGLLHIGKFNIHVLPIIMTIINFVSGAIYTNEAPFREKIQLYIVAILFLVLLYSSPSGLVIYWILNNIFSLIKNITIKMKKPGKILHLCVSAILLFVSAYFFTREGKMWKKVFLLGTSVFVTFFPFINDSFINVFHCCKGKDKKTNVANLVLCGLSLAILCGLLLPSSAIATSPIEFSFLGNTESPLSYIATALPVFLGFFVFWPFVIYKMFNQNVKYAECCIFFVLLIFAFSNVFLCRPNLSEISSVFTFKINSVPGYYHLITLMSLIIGILLFILANKSKKNFMPYILLSVCIAEIFVCATKINTIKAGFNNYKIAKSKVNNPDSCCDEEFTTVYNLSKTGKNVVILFLDRAIGSFEPYIFETVPELKEKFKGFTYYPNTLSFGCHTVFGFPPLSGGYEYTQEKMNERDTELLVKKHNEAMLVMPKLFYDAGYDVTFTDPPFSNYRWKGDLTPFDSFPEMHVSELQGRYTQKYKKDVGWKHENKPDEYCRKNIIAYSFLQIIPPAFRQTFYNFAIQDDKYYNDFFDQISSLYYINNLTGFSNRKDSFIFIDNETCHNPVFLKSDNYLIPCSTVQSSIGTYKPLSDDENADFTTNTAVFILLGEWFDYLRQNDCYDNTRIIIVADHGFNHKYTDFKDFSDPVVPSSYNPLLMVKDFDCNNDLSTDNSFMTNADTLFIAKKDLNISDINPFTSKEFRQEKETVHVYPEGFENEYNAEIIRDKTKFVLNKSKAWSVSKNIFDEENWIPLSQAENTYGGKK